MRTLNHDEIAMVVGADDEVSGFCSSTGTTAGNIAGAASALYSSTATGNPYVGISVGPTVSVVTNSIVTAACDAITTSINGAVGDAHMWLAYYAWPMVRFEVDQNEQYFTTSWY